MENCCKRFPAVGKMILENLDNLSLIQSKKASRGISSFLENERFFVLRLIQKYCKDFKKFEEDKVSKLEPIMTLKVTEGFGESWNEVINKTPIDILKQLAVAIHKFIKSELLGAKMLPLYVAYNTQSVNSKTIKYAPLPIDAKRGKINLSKYIITKTTNKNPVSNSMGETVLHIAARDGHLDFCQLIINHVENKSPVDNFRETPLHIAAGNGHLDICRLIIENVEFKNPARHDGETPPHKAASSSHLDICKLIIEKVGNKYPVNSWGKTPKDYVKCTKSCEFGRNSIWIMDNGVCRHCYNKHDMMELFEF